MIISLKIPKSRISEIVLLYPFLANSTASQYFRSTIIAQYSHQHSGKHSQEHASIIYSCQTLWEVFTRKSTSQSQHLKVNTRKSTFQSQHQTDNPQNSTPESQHRKANTRKSTSTFGRPATHASWAENPGQILTETSIEGSCHILDFQNFKIQNFQNINMHVNCKCMQSPPLLIVLKCASGKASFLTLEVWDSRILQYS